jgi:hypothetical protein
MEGLDDLLDEFENKPCKNFVLFEAKKTSSKVTQKVSGKSKAAVGK